jgi:hypothetical protein
MNQSTLLIKSRRKTKQIVSIEVTKEDVADRKMLKPLVYHVTTSQHLFHTQQRIGYRQ